MRSWSVWVGVVLLSVGTCGRVFAAPYHIPVGTYVDSATDLASCGGTLHACGARVVAMLNIDRAARHVAPLRLNAVQSSGETGCVGSFGHAVVMARTGSIWHTSVRHPLASFPRNVCGAYSTAGENVGVAGSGDALASLQSLDHMMMTEPHTRSVCATTVNHACNILNPAFSQVGIGVYVDKSGSTWLTEDFTG